LSEVEEEINLEDYWRVIVRRKWTIILSLIVITTSAITFSFLRTPIYEASTTLYIKEGEVGGAMDILGGGGPTGLSSQTILNTYKEILKSRTVLGEVVKKLNLDKKSENKEKSFYEIIEDLREKISVDTVVNTRLLEVTVSSPDPEMAKKIANTVAEVFIRRNISSQRRESNAALSFLSDQVEKVGERLREAEERLKEYKEKESFGELSEQARLLVNQLSELEGSYQQAKISREEIEARLLEIRNQLREVDREWVSSTIISNNPIVQNLRAQLTNLQIRLAQLEREFSPQDPQIIQVKAQIEETKRQLQNEVETVVSSKVSTISPVYTQLYTKLVNYETEVNALRAKEEALKDLISRYRNKVEQLPEQELKLARLERDVKVNESLYITLLEAKNKTEIQSASEIGSIEVIDPAIKPIEPVKPNKKLNTLVGLVLGLFCGVGLAFVREYMDKTIKTEDEIRTLLGLPVLGIIPRFNFKKSPFKTKIKSEEERKIETISLTNPKSTISEAFRTLKTNLQFAEVEGKIKALIITSSVPEEGKTSIGINLAITFAQAGEKTLLVDADLRKPKIHNVFGLSRDPGLTNILTTGKSYQDVVRKLEDVEGLDVLTTGPLPPNPLELLGSSKMKKLISELIESYERVIVDTPPSAVLTDAPLLSRQIRNVLMVLSVGEAQREAAKKSKEALQRAKANILGVVLNKVALEREGYGYYYYYYPEEKEK